MAYESPIEVYVKNVAKDINNKMEETIDNEIMLTVEQKMGMHIDKEELAKALSYDRNQYHKGFKDGFDHGRAAGLNEVLEIVLNYAKNGPGGESWWQDPDGGVHRTNMLYAIDFLGELKDYVDSIGGFEEFIRRIMNESE